ncbi:MAG: glycosyltransferase [Rhodoferax sp.]|nr:glycosyltransferase [Rhodoferax sp.]
MKNKTLCLCMIVKNESHIILETLNSIKQYIDYWVICDTGSTDNTMELIQDFFDKQGIKGEIHSEKWVDFGYNRTRVFELAHKKADYLWVIDADDTLVGQINLDELLDLDFYLLRYGNDFTYWRGQIFKGSERWIYKGVLHEYPFCLSKDVVTKGCINGDYHVVSRRLGARNFIDPAVKYQNDARILEQALHLEKDSELISRYLFYLAQSYRDAGQLELAIEWYQKRIAQGGWAEEVWFSKYEIGKIQEKLGDFISARNSYLDAFEYRPSRAESLYSLGKMCNLRQEFHQAYLYLGFASTIPFTNDELFVSKDVYDYEIVFELSISAYWIGNYQHSIGLCNQLIGLRNKMPRHIYEQTLKNMIFGIEKLSPS